MASWTFTREAAIGGRFHIVFTGPGGRPRDVTFLRGVPTEIGSYSSADPFGDATAQITFPQLTVMDDPSSPELDFWRDDADVDIWWVPAFTQPDGWVPTGTGETALYFNPLTGAQDLVAPAFEWDQGSDGVWRQTTKLRAIKIWEGFVASWAVSSTDSGDTIAASCTGALFQGDHKKAKPYFPPRPQTVESLILAQFDRTTYPDLRTHAPVIEWPTGWTLTAPTFTGSNTTFDPNVKPGQRWTGYTTRQTGSWDAALTSFIANQLAILLVKPGSGSPAGDQWTLRMAHRGDPKYPAGRTPVLMVRRRDRAPDITLRAGQIGVQLNLDRDSSQRVDLIYGTGTDLAGTTWRNAVISANGARTDYLPLASRPDVYPMHGNANYSRGRMAREGYSQYGAGMSQTDAADTSDQMLGRDRDAGWAGSITLSIDPSATLSRWQIQAGMVVRLKGFVGTGEDGVLLHIASCEASPNDGTVTLTVDTRYRDLLTLREAIDRNRDPLTPSKLLQLNRNSVTIEDIQAPWDYSAGSGFVPKTSQTFYSFKDITLRFPYSSWAKAHPPRKHPSWYVMCHANNPQSKKRWAGPIRILMAEKGTIRRSEFFCVDRYGNLVPIRFHVSLYYNNGIDATFMPHDGKGTYSPFIYGAFQSIDPTTGQPWSTPGHDPDPSMIQGWGNAGQPAGYSPGLYSQGAKPTGLLVDESSWSFDCSTNNPNYDQLAKAGKEAASVISIYAMFYAEHDEAVYFGGRLFREEPGTSS